VRNEEDVATVRRALKRLGRPSGLVAKIETKLALENLDAILARRAVMIARGTCRSRFLRARADRAEAHRAGSDPRRPARDHRDADAAVDGERAGDRRAQRSPTWRTRCSTAPTP
jgi:hypothetical protein